MYLGNVYGMLANAVLLLAIAIVVIVTDRIKIRRYEREIAELEYEIEKYKPYDEEEEWTDEEIYEFLDKEGAIVHLDEDDLIRRNRIRNCKNSGRYPGTNKLNNYDLSKDKEFKEH